MTKFNGYLTLPANDQLAPGESFTIGEEQLDGGRIHLIACVAFQMRPVAVKALENAISLTPEPSTVDALLALKQLLLEQGLAVEPQAQAIRQFLVPWEMAVASSTARQGLASQSLQQLFLSAFERPYVPRNLTDPSFPVFKYTERKVSYQAVTAVQESAAVRVEPSPIPPRPLVNPPHETGFPLPQLEEGQHFVIRLGKDGSVYDFGDFYASSPVHLDTVFDKLLRSSSMTMSVLEFFGNFADAMQRYGVQPLPRIANDQPYLIFHVHADQGEPIGHRGSIRADVHQTFHGDVDHILATVRPTVESS